MSGAALRLRRYEPGDLPSLLALVGDRQVMRYVGEGTPLDVASASALMDRIFEIYETDPSFLVSEARKRKLPFIIATVHPENFASSAILCRRGFTWDGALSQELDCHAYRLNLDRASE